MKDKLFVPSEERERKAFFDKKLIELSCKDFTMDRKCKGKERLVAEGLKNFQCTCQSHIFLVFNFA